MYTTPVDIAMRTSFGIIAMYTVTLSYLIAIMTLGKDSHRAHDAFHGGKGRGTMHAACSRGTINLGSRGGGQGQGQGRDLTR